MTGTAPFGPLYKTTIFDANPPINENGKTVCVPFPAIVMVLFELEIVI